MFYFLVRENKDLSSASHVCCPVLTPPARGCTWLTSAGQARGARWQEVTNGGVSRREAGWRRVRCKITLGWLLTPFDGFQLLLLRPSHVYDICACVAPLAGGVSPPWHFPPNACRLSHSSFGTQHRSCCWVHETCAPHARCRILQGTSWFSNCVQITLYTFYITSSWFSVKDLKEILN